MRFRAFILLGAFLLFLIPSCTNGVYDPAKGNAFAAATTSPVVTVGVPAVATVIGGPATGAGVAAIVGAFGAVTAAVVGYLNHRKGSSTSDTVNDIATTVTDVANAVSARPGYSVPGKA